MKKSILRILRILKMYLVSQPLKFCYRTEVKLKVGGYKSPLNVNSRSKVGSNTYLGANVNFNGITIKGGGKVVIGDNFHSGSNILILPRFHNFDTGTKIPYDNTFIHKNVCIMDNVWLGDRVIILGGVTIGEGAIIQAGAVVVSDVPDFGIAGGSPAKVFKYRDIEHYKKLKKLKQFN